LFLSSISIPVYAYEVEIHEKITDQAISMATNYSKFINSLKLDQEEASQAIKTGSTREDDPFFDLPILNRYCRCAYHFYDPTTQLGLNCPERYLSGQVPPALEF